MAVATPHNAPMSAGLGERCPKCSLGLMQRANIRSKREGVLFLLGASILRCSSCEIRQAAWKNFRMQMNADETDSTFVVVFASLACGLLICVAIALWTLRHAHRWPF
jgi:uncharacterized protein (DUF983 family)